MNPVEKGAYQAVNVCMKISPSDKVVIVTDKDTKFLSDLIKNECLKITDNIIQFILEDFGERPLKILPDKIKAAIIDSTAVFYMAKSKPGEKVSLRMPIVELGTKNGREAHMPDITTELMEQGMNTDYKKVKEISKRVYDLVKIAKEIRVTTSLGSDFKATFNPKWKWLICDGDITEKASDTATGWSNLPDGEVFTSPLSVNGKIIIDGCVGDYFSSRGLLKKPIILEAIEGRVSSLICEDKELEKELQAYIKQDENASRIGEFAIGTNIGLKKLVGNLLQDEKFPGIHIAVGDSYPKSTLAPFPSIAHCDFVIKKTNIFVDDKQIMKEGIFII